MKKIIFIGIGAVLLIIVAILSWQHVKAAKEDAKTFRRLIGDWGAHDSEGLHDVRDIRSDGSFTVSVIPANNWGLLYHFEGTLQIKNGNLIETITNHSDTNVHVPFTLREQIVHINDNRFIVRTNGTTNELIFWKIQH